MWAGVGVGEWRVKMSFKFGNSKRLSATMAGLNKVTKMTKMSARYFLENVCGHPGLPLG